MNKSDHDTLDWFGKTRDVVGMSPRFENVCIPVRLRRSRNTHLEIHHLFLMLHGLPTIRPRAEKTAPSLVHDMYVAEREGLDPVRADGSTLGEVLLRGTAFTPGFALRLRYSGGWNPFVGKEMSIIVSGFDISFRDTKTRHEYMRGPVRLLNCSGHGRFITDQ